MSKSAPFTNGEPEMIPFDIETTGFQAVQGNHITTIVLYHNGLYHVFLNVEGDRDVEIEDLYQEIGSGTELTNFVIHLSDSEKSLLTNFQTYVKDATDYQSVLTAFNGETRNGSTDFDVPFLRTRCFMNGMDWILRGVWYTDTYEVLGKKNRLDTTVEAEPSLERMKRSDLTTFVDDMGFDIHYESMNKDKLVEVTRNHPGSTSETISSWAKEQEVFFNKPHPDNFRKKDLKEFCEQYNVLQHTDEDSFRSINKADLQEVIAQNFMREFTAFAEENFQIYPTDPSDLKSSELKQYVNEKSLNISYNKMSKSTLIDRIRESDYTEQMLLDWHEEKGRDIGNETKTTLEDIHEVLIETNEDSGDSRFPFDLEEFTPFDPYESSGEAVTGYNNGDYSGVVLHCFADVARTVNITNLMQEYISQKDYQPKIL